jgi:hypothetical protein
VGGMPMRTRLNLGKGLLILILIAVVFSFIYSMFFNEAHSALSSMPSGSLTKTEEIDFFKWLIGVLTVIAGWYFINSMQKFGKNQDELFKHFEDHADRLKVIETTHNILNCARKALKRRKEDV